MSFSGSAAPAITWIDATHYVVDRERRPTDCEWMKVDAATGTPVPLFDAARWKRRWSLPAFRADEARRAARSRTLTFDRAYTAALFTIDDDLYVYTFADRPAVRLTTTEPAEEDATFSPDGARSRSCGRQPVLSPTSRPARRRALTTDGTARFSTAGSTGSTRRRSTAAVSSAATGGAPTRARLAFLRSTIAGAEYTVVDHIPYEQNVEQWDYPKAGDPNPIVKLGVVARRRRPAALGRHRPKYPAADRLIVGVDLDARQPAGRRIRCRTARRPGSTEPADADTGATADASSARRASTG